MTLRMSILSIIDPDFPTETFAHSLDEPITENEVLKAIKHLKSGKSKGLDNVSNEYIINSSHVLTKLYVKLINYVLNRSCIPESWLLGQIIPIFKNKGSIENPENYRRITILSCLGKLFNIVLNSRLTSFLETNELLRMNHAGFRKGNSTIDTIFMLHIPSVYFKHKKKTYSVLSWILRQLLIQSGELVYGQS